MSKPLKKVKKLPYQFNILYEKIVNSIAFVPALIGAAFFGFSALLLFAEQKGITDWMEERLISFLLIKDWGVAESLLTTLIGALISLMVFSFSMVMVLLNNAAANYSPRIIPNLIANKFHQIVLGNYLGTIILCLILVLNMTPSQPKIPLPSFSVLVGISMGIVCLILFIFFIHSVSVSVQVQRISESLFKNTEKNLVKGLSDNLGSQSPPENSKDWFNYASDRTGFIKKIKLEELQEIMEENDLKIKFLANQSNFVLVHTRLFSCDKELKEEILEKVLSTVVFTNNELVDNDPVIGFKQLTEIAVKAMSPGINDPGTALAIIDYLTLLFREKMQNNEAGAVINPKEKEKENISQTRIWLKIVGFDYLLRIVIVSIRQYANQDMVVTLKLLTMLRHLSEADFATAGQLQAIRREAHSILSDAKDHLKNPEDLGQIQQYYEKYF